MAEESQGESQSQSQSSSQGSSSNQGDKLINLQAQQLAAQVANWAAQLEFQKERMRLLELPEMQGKLQIDIDRLAFDKASQVWEQSFKEATLTGTFNGQPTIDWLMKQAELTGVLDGRETLTGRLTSAQIREMDQKMALANAEFMSNSTGYLNGQKTFDRQKWEASQATDAWKFLATLTGPSNAFRQARAIGSMPGGLEQMMGSWAGQYATPGSTSVGSGGQANIWGLMQGYGGNFAPGPYQPSPYSYAPSGPPPGVGGGYYNPYGGGGYPGGGGGGGYGGYPGGYGGGGYSGGGSPPPAGGGTYTPSAPGGGTPGAAPVAPPAAAPPAPAGETQLTDRGFLAWLYSQGITPGDPSYAPRLEELKTVYQGFGAEGQNIWRNEANKAGVIPNTPLDLSAWGGPVQPALPTGGIPGRGFSPTQWNDATRQAVTAWEASHPGYKADGSQVGYYWTGWGPEPQAVKPPPAPWQPPGPGEVGIPRPPDTIGKPPPQIVPPGPGEVGIAGGIPFMGETPAPFQTQSTHPNAAMMAASTAEAYGTAPSGWRPSYVDPRQYAEFDAMPPALKQQYWEWGMSGGDANAAAAAKAGPGYTPQPVGSGDLARYASGASTYSFQAPGVQAPANEWNYSPTLSGSMMAYPPGVTSDYSTPDISSPTPMNPQQAYNIYTFGNTGAGTTQWDPSLAWAGRPTTHPVNLPEDWRSNPASRNLRGNEIPINQGTIGGGALAPNQINAANYNNQYQYQKDLGWAWYEDQGYDKGLAQEAFAKSLPKFGGPKSGHFAF